MLIEMPRGSSIHNGEKAARDESVVAPYLQEVQSVLNRSLRPGSYSSLASRLQPASNGTSASSSRKNRSGSRLLPAGYRDGLNGHVEVPEIDTLDVALKYDVAVQINPKTQESSVQCEAEPGDGCNIEAVQVQAVQQKAEYEDVFEENFLLRRIIDDLQFRLDDLADEAVKERHGQQDDGSGNVIDVARQSDAEGAGHPMDGRAEPMAASHVSASMTSQMVERQQEELRALLTGHACRLKLLDDVKYQQVQNAQALLTAMLVGHSRRRHFLQALNS